MKLYKLIIIILIVFTKTGNVLSDNNIFNVNNIIVEKKTKITNNALANIAIKKGFNQLTEKILLENDRKKLLNLEFSQIKELVIYYQVANNDAVKEQDEKKINYNISFDKDKLHDLFYKNDISYSKIENKEIYILPILKKNDKIFVYNQNYFYSKWNDTFEIELIDFILPLENIEIIEYINLNKNNLLDLNLNTLFTEYNDKNLALIIIESKNSDIKKIYLKTKILEKSIVKNIKVNKSNLNEEEFYKKIIGEVKLEIVDIIKSQNLIDIRTPSFLNVRLDIDKNNNFADLSSKLKKINLIENIFIQEFNNESVFFKIKYLGKLDKLTSLLENQKISLSLIGDEWSIRIIK